MVKDGELVNPRLYTLAAKGEAGSQVGQLADAEAIATEISRGSTLILQGLHRFHPPAGRLARELEDDLGTRVFINAYLTPNSSKGFGEHSDPYGAFLLQLSGAKQWKLRPSADAAGKTIILNSLDVLWIPRGWLHDGAAMPGNSSVHLTVAVNPISLEDVLSEITGKVAARVRGTVLPPHPDRDQEALEDTVRKVSALLRTALDGIDYRETAKTLLMRAAIGNGTPSMNVSAAFGAGQPASSGKAAGNR
jgi:ribosomal protein L16 Arg81 hydroxylase